MAQISGTVFRDFNANGVRETPGEIGVGGVTVTIVSTNGVSTTTTTSSVAATLGTYLVALPGGTGPFRIEFSNLPTGYFAGPKGTNSGTTVQFAAAGATNVSLGINYPTDYSQANPYYLVPCYVNGDPLNSTGNAGAQGSLIVLPYNSVGDNPAEFPLATGSQIGSVFGVAYQRTARQAYTAAFVKRHSGLGTGGAGAIYLTKATDASFTTFTSSVFATLPLTIPVASNTTRNLPGTTTTVNQDPLVFDQVGKTGLGDIELSEDGTQLYAVNLSDQKLYRIPINNAASNTPTANTAGITSFSIGTGTGCRTGSVYRPFALKAYRGKLYVGGVCTNESVPTTTTTNFGAGTNNTANLITRDTTGMKAIVYEFNPVNNTFASAIAFPLTYRKGNSNNDQNGVERANYWLPWTDVVPGSTAVPSRFARGDAPNISYPQPWLTGIEFDVDGSMILSIRDRTGDQFGNNNLSPISTTTFYRTVAPGDILRASKCTPNAALWTLENNASVCGGTSTLGINNGQGPGGGEYYYSDAVAVPNTVTPYHLEMAQGGLALLPGSGEVASIVMDPTDNIESGGIRRFKNSDGSGSPSTSVQIFFSGTGVSTYGKANGLGDLELASDNPPIEIGNRVWNDGDSQGADGLQGATNTFIAGVTVTLYLNGSPVVSTVTSAAGEYYFNSTNVPGGLLPNTNYEIRIPMNQSALTNFIPTVYKAGTNSALDNDGVLVNGFTVIALTTGNYGEDNHTYDFGFVTCPTITNPSPAVSVCSGTSVSSLSVATTATGTNTIQFVYFTSPQSGTAMYTGGTSLTTATPTSGAATITNVAFPANTTGAAVVYYVYAILTPTPGAVDCRPTQQILVTINPVVSITITGNPSLTICSGSSTTLTASASGGTGFTYRWNTGATTPTLSVSPTTTTTYSVTVTSNTGCFSTSSATVTVNPALTTLTASASPTTICSGASSNLTASASGGTGITYLWSNGITTATQSVSPTVTTVFTVTATNSTGCTRTASTTVTVNPAVTVTVGSQTICTGTSATLTANASGGSGFTYIWAPAGTGTTQTVIVTPTPTTNYSVTVTNSNGCSAVATATITVNPAVTAVIAVSPSSTICNGTSATLTASGGTTYRWSTGGTTAAISVAPASTTAFSVTVTNGNGCSAIASTTITVNPAVTATLGSAVICNGTTASLTATGGSSYTLSNGAINTTGIFSVTPSSTTTYTVTVANTSGCVGTATGMVTVNPAVTAVIAVSPSSTICNGTSATLTASGGTTYGWSTGATTSSIQVSPTATATYSVTVSNANGCSASTSTTITVTPAVMATVASQTICNGTSTILTATASGGSGFTYVWRPAGTGSTQSVTVSPSATTSYTVTVTNSNGCSAVATAMVTVNPAVTAVIAANPSLTICNGTSTTLTASGGTAYVWSTGAVTAAIPVSPTVTTAYSVTVTNAFGCSAIASTTVTVNPAVTATVASATICNGTSATLTANATGGTGFTYNWAPTGTGTTPTVVVTPTATTTYSVTVTNSNGCSAVATATVTVNAAVTATLGSTTICNGTSGTLVASGGSTYIFSNGTTNNTGILIVSPATTTIYSVTVSNGNNCSAIASGTVTVNPAVTATVANATICNGTSATLTAMASGGSGFTYLWSTGASTSAITVSPTTSTPYSVTVTNSNGCFTTATSTVLVNPAVTVTVASQTICRGTSATLTAMASGGTGLTYAWLPAGTGSTPSVLVSPTATTTYSVIVTNSNGCSAVATATVTVNAAVTATLSSATICNGNSATLTATGGTTYRFGPGIINTTGQFTVSPTTVGANPYSVTVTSAPGCSAVATSTVTVNPLPVPTIMGTATVCAGQPISLTASPTTGLTYQWSGPGGNLGTTNPLTIANSTSANSGTYQVLVTDVNGCTATATYNVTVKPVPFVQITNTSIVCNNNSPAVVIATQVTGGTPPVTYAWYRSGAAGVISTSPNPAFSTPDTYSVIVTDASGCMSNTATVNVMTPNPLAVNVQTTNALCYNANGRITITVSGGLAPYTVSYYNAGGLLSTTTTSGSSSLQTPAGSYTVVAMDANGCSLTQTAALTQPPLLVVTLTGGGPVCAGQFTGTISSSVSGGTAPYTYAWNTGATTATLTNLGGGSYSVVVTDANGCVTSQTLTLATNPLPAPPSVSVTQPTCVTLTGTIQVLTPASGVQYSFDNGVSYQASPTRTGLQPDTYRLTVKDNATGCVSPVTSVTINPVPTPPVASIAGNTVYCAGTPISLTASPASGVSYAWQGPAGSLGSANPLVVPTTSVAQSGVYRVTVTDVNGCTATASATITVNPAVTATVANATICNGTSATLTANATGGIGFTYAWSPVGTGATQRVVVAPSVTTVYTVTVTNSTGCSAIASATVTVNPAVTATITSSTSCNSISTTLTASSSQTGLTYQWSGPGGFTAGGTSIVVSNAGSYTLLATNGQTGCASTTTATVSALTILTTTVNSATLTCQVPSATLTASSSQTGLTYQWSGPAGFTATTQSVTVTVAGSYTVVASNPQTGCSSTAIATVTQDPGISVTLTQSSCRNNGTDATAADDYYTITISAINTGNAGLYEVVIGANANGIGGTVLNPGGTAYGTSVTVGGVGQVNAKGFRADGTTLYPILIRTLGTPTCRAYRLTGEVAPCSSCLTAPCIPPAIRKQ